MANDGTVKIGTELDHTGFKSGLSGLGSFASKGFGAIGGAAAGMAGITVAALAGVATGMGALVVSGVKYNAAMENYTSSFTTMLGSEEAAIAKVNELKKLGASTPFEMADLASGTTALLAYGIAADDSTGILSMLGDISLGNAEKLSGLTNVYGKMTSTGKLTGETLEGMISNGFNPLNIIAETTGESMDELRERMSKGAISADEVAAAFKVATSEGGQFYEGMKTASTTFDGLISTLKDNANSLVGEVVKPISDSMTKTLLPEAIGMVSTLTDAFAKDGIPGLITAAGGVVGQILSGITAQLPAVITMANSFLTTLISALLVQLPTLSAAGTGIVTGLLNSMITQIPQLLLFGMSLIVNILDGLAAAMPTLIPAAQAAILLIAGILAENLNYILDAGIQILVALLEGIVGMLPELIQTFIGMSAMMIETIIANLPAIITAAIQILLALIAGIASAIPQLIAMLPTIITTIVTTLLNNLPMIIKTAVQILVALITGLANAIPLLIEMVPDIIASIITTLIENLPLIIESAIDIIMALVTGLITALPAIIAMVPKIGESIGKALKDIDWGTLGKNMIDGIKNGFINAAGGLVKAAKEAVSGAIDGVKKFLNINSPSKLTRDVLGKPIIEGVGRGIEDESGTLEDTAVGTMRHTVKSMQGVSASGMLSQMQGQAYGRSSGLTSTSAATIAASKQDAFDYDAQAKSTAKAMNGMKVEMDGQTVGRMVAPFVDTEMGNMSSLKARYA